MGNKYLKSQTYFKAAFKSSSSIGNNSLPGNTPDSKLLNKGTSSATNFGTIVSQTLLINIFYSNSMNYESLNSSVLIFFVS